MPFRFPVAFRFPAPLRSGITAILAASLTLGAALPALAQTAYLESAAYEAGEGQGSVIVRVLVSAPVTGGGVVVEVADSTAAAGSDYTAIASEYLSWSGDASPREIPITILDDPDIEAPEQLIVRIAYGKGVAVGEPSEAIVTIVDNDGSGDPIPYIEVGASIPNVGGDYVMFAEGGSTVNVTVRLDRLPAAPFAVDFTSGFAPFAGTILFDGTTERTVTLDAPVPPGGEASVAGDFEVHPASPARRMAGDPPPGRVTFLSWLTPTFDECVLCFLYSWLARGDYTDCPEFCELSWMCDAGAAMRGGAVIPDRIETLRRYRDEVLALTPGGQHFAALYTQHSGAAAVALLRDPTFVFGFVSDLEVWVPALDALLAGNGDTVVITPAMQDALNDVLDELAALGNPGLAAAIATERARVGTDGIAGQTMEAFQSDVEQAGTTSLEPASWGRLKSLYR